MVQIHSQYSGRDPAVRDFFFATAKLKGQLRYTDKVLLAVDGSTVVGGILLRNEETICVYANSDSIRDMLTKESKKIKC
jgi:hypothetical protein